MDLRLFRVREVADRSKPHCFELFAAGNEVIKACKTDSEGKVVEGELKNDIRIDNLFLALSLGNFFEFRNCSGLGLLDYCCHLMIYD